MVKLFSKFRQKMDSGFDSGDEAESEYLEIDTANLSSGSSRILVKPFTIHDFEDIKDVLDSLRTGSVVALVNIKPLKDKDIIELKRAINKLKKTCDAIDGDVAGFSEDWIVATPSARISIHKQTGMKAVESVEN